MDERVLIDEVKEMFVQAADNDDSEVWQIISTIAVPNSRSTASANSH